MRTLPQREEMQGGLRVVEHAHPEIAIRELVANALIHQDLSAGDAGPIIEIFSDRLQITNPGAPIIPIERIIDTPSRSRNKRLARMMRDLKLCEERGSGIDRALDAIEQRSLPPPLFTSVADSTVVVLYAERSFAAMNNVDRLRACYQHACLRHQANDPMSNGSLRSRLGLSERQYSQVSRVIADAIEARLIVPLEDGQPNRLARYVPCWAKPETKNM
jgi:ATP-dependent DNA helicase RecG